jgi:hypothetical protein
MIQKLLGWICPDQALRVAAGILGERDIQMVTRQRNKPCEFGKVCSAEILG